MGNFGSVCFELEATADSFSALLTMLSRSNMSKLSVADQVG
jgi:hypothetical protein